MTLSKETESYLLDLKVLLLTQGKSEQECNSFLEEAESHMIEAEKEGKSVYDVFGEPKAYAKSLSSQMTTEKKKNVKLIVSFVIGFLCFIVIQNAISGHFSYTWLGAVAQPLLALLWLGTVIVALRQSTYPKNKLWSWAVTYMLVMIPMLATVGYLLALKFYKFPTQELSSLGSYMVAIVAAVVMFIVFSILIQWKASAIYVGLMVVVLFTFQLLNGVHITFSFLAYPVCMLATFLVFNRVWKEEK